MKLKIVIIAVISILILFLFFPREMEVYPKPIKAKDTDGTPQEEILENMKNGFEMVILKFYPFGYLEITEWEKVRFLKEVYAIIEWRTYKGLGAGNIYIGYSFDGKNYIEFGPFNESENITKTVIKIPVNIFSDISRLKIRFRGEDIDFALDAIAEVNIKLKVIKYKFGWFE